MLEEQPRSRWFKEGPAPHSSPRIHFLKDSSYCIWIDNWALRVIGPIVAFIFAVK